MSEADSAFLTSSATPIASPFSAFIRSSVAEQSFVSAVTTRAPAAARLRANSCPIPRAAPVITTTLSRTANSVVLSGIASSSRSFTLASPGIRAVFAVWARNYQPASLEFPQKSWGDISLCTEEQQITGCFFADTGCALHRKGGGVFPLLRPLEVHVWYLTIAQLRRFVNTNA